MRPPHPLSLQARQQALAELPLPSIDAQTHSEAVIEHICTALQNNGGPISFADFMALALYAPGLGYYSAGSQKFGAEGDFVTAPELSPLFSRCIGRQSAEILRQLEDADILEIGAGSGRMAADLLTHLATLEELPARYFILELSADLRQRQQQTLTAQVPQLMDRIQWLTALPTSGFRGVLLANEVLDAMPVHLFEITAQGPMERCVGWDGARFCWQLAEIEAPLFRARLEQCPQRPIGYQSELNLAAEAWVSALGDMFEAGVALLIDYGFPRHEYYHPERDRGTLMCHYRHRAHDDPFVFPGLQDITAHVDFTAMAEAAVSAGLSVAGYTTQGHFLLATGITEHVDSADQQQRLSIAQQIRTLTLPGEMGERFKVMALSYDPNAQLTIPLRGFGLSDFRGRL